MQARVNVALYGAALPQLRSAFLPPEHPEDFVIQIFLRDTIDRLLRGGGGSGG